MDEAAQPELPRWQRIGPDFVGLIEVVERRFGLIAAAFVVALAAEAISIFFAATYDAQFINRITVLAENPFAKGEIPHTHIEHRLRILGPVIAWGLGLHGMAAAWVPVMANVPLLMLLYGMLARRLSRPTAITAVILMATTHVTMSSRMLLGYQDSLAFLLMLAAMAAPNIVLSGLFLFLGCFGDQRAIFAVPYILAWRAWVDDLHGGLALQRFLVRGVFLTAVVGAWVALSRALLHSFQIQAPAGIAIGTYYLGDLLRDLKPGYLQIGLFMCFKAAWIFPLVLLWMWAGKRPLLAAMLGASTLTILVLSAMITDMSRTASFCFPAVILGIVVLGRSDERRCFDMVGACLLVNLISPFYQAMNTGLWMIGYPLPVELAKWWLARGG
jgi:hypothetical protein